MTRVVGIGGKLQHGKDVVADHLVKEYGWVKLGMSDALAEALYVLDPLIPVTTWPSKFGWFRSLVCRIIFGKNTSGTGVVLPYSYLVDEIGYVEAKKFPEVRRLLQVLGTEVGRKMISETVWTDIIHRNVQKHVDSGVPGVIVTGIRFPNETELISEDLGGELWWVVRPLAPGTRAKHSSEGSVESADFDLVLYNDSTVSALKKKVDGLVIL